MKSISTINPAITENMESSIVEASTPIINLKVGVSLDHCASLCFVSLPVLQTLQEKFQEKNSIKSASTNTALAQVLHQSHNAHTANRHLRGSEEINGAQRRTKVSWQSHDASTGVTAVGKKARLRTKRHRAVQKLSPYIALTVIELHLSKGISKYMSELVIQQRI